MNEDGLNGLAPLHVHHDISVNSNDIIDIFARKYSRRIKLLNILDDSEKMNNLGEYI